jgi:PAS domain S-box-containing protein
MTRPNEMGPEQEVTSAYRRGHKAMHVSDKFYRALFVQAGDMFTVLDRDGAVLHQSEDAENALAFNPARRDEYSLFDVTHPEDAARVRDGLQRCAATTDWVSVDAFRILLRNGSW